MDGGTEPGVPAERLEEKEELGYREQLLELQRLYDRVVEKRQKCFGELEYQPTVEGCMAALEYEPGLEERFASGSNGKRVLILDNGMELASMLRLASRLVALYRVSEDGNLFMPYTPGAVTEYVIPTPLKEIATNRLVRESPLPPSALAPLLTGRTNQMLRQADLDYRLGDPSFNHGIGLVVKLRDLVPDVELVVVSANGTNELSIGPEGFCAAGRGDFAPVTSYYATLEADLVELVESSDADYVSLSSYATARGYQSAWSQLCPGETISAPDAESLAALREEMVSRVARATSALLFQSAAPPTVDLGTSVEELLTTCQGRSSNHLLVSHATTPLNTSQILEIGENGEVYSQYLAGANSTLQRCGVSLYSLDALTTPIFVPVLNRKILRPVESAVVFDMLGLSDSIPLGPTWPASSSFVPPVAIAHSIFLQEAGLSRVEVLAELEARPIRAPQRYNQFPVCQLDDRFCDAAPDLLGN